MIHRLFARTIVGSLLCFAAASSGAHAQDDPPKVTKAAAAGCPKLDTKNLEQNQDVLDAAKSLTTQMVRAYDNSSSKSRPDLSGLLGNFHGKLLLAAYSCSQKAAELSDVNSAKAKAVTGQTNKQLGASASSDGSTSAVQKVGIPQLLGVAVEDGAVTSNVSGTTLTLSSTPYGFVSAFSKKFSGDFDNEANYRDWGILARTGVSATFNLGNASDPLASATRKQVSQWQGKITLRETSVRSFKVKDYFESSGLRDAATKRDAVMSNRILSNLERPFDPAVDPVYEKLWNDSLQTLLNNGIQGDDQNKSGEIDTAANLILKALDADTVYQKTLSSALNDLANEGGNFGPLEKQFEAAQKDYVDRRKHFEDAAKSLTKGWNGDFTFGQKYPTTTTTGTTASGASVGRGTLLGRLAAATTTTSPHAPAYIFAEFDLSCDPKDEIKGAMVAGGAYDNNAILVRQSHCPLFASGTWTTNVTGTFYSNPNAALNEKTFRGVTGALQAQWNLGPGLATKKTTNDSSQMTLALSGSYERLEENKDQKGKKLDILLGDVKLDIPISSGVSFPLSFSVANATEQVKGTYVKGHFGLTFDLDKLVSLLQASH
jgi:hypothetical protein